MKKEATSYAIKEDFNLACPWNHRISDLAKNVSPISTSCILQISSTTTFHVHIPPRPRKETIPFLFQWRVESSEFFSAGFSPSEFQRWPRVRHWRAHACVRGESRRERYSPTHCADVSRKDRTSRFFRLHNRTDQFSASQNRHPTDQNEIESERNSRPHRSFDHPWSSGAGARIRERKREREKKDLLTSCVSWPEDTKTVDCIETDDRSVTYSISFSVSIFLLSVSFFISKFTDAEKPPRATCFPVGK